MTNKEKVIIGLESHLNAFVPCKECPYRGGVDCKDELLKDAVELLKVGVWTSVKDQLPESGKHVLAACKFKTMFGDEKTYICEAFHADKYSVSTSTKDTDCYEYDEDDECYIKEGWYEVIHNLDEYSSVAIDETVTSWTALPEPPEEETT